MASLLLRGGRVLDPANDIDKIADVLIVNGKIVSIESAISPSEVDDSRDVSGCLVVPGLIDAHVHFRDPGLTYKEDLQTGANSALAGGFVRVCCMPNTSPALDSPERIRDIVERGRGTGIHIHPIGTITVGRLLEDIAPLAEMAEAGAIGFSDDGESTRSEETMLEALRLASALDRPIMVHCEDPALASGGVMNEGDVSARLGLKGIPAAAEEDYIQRDIRLAEESGGWLHVLHVSTVKGATAVREAKRRGSRVTAEVMPHHLLLTDEWVAGLRRFAGSSDPADDIGRTDPNAIVNPPLRPESDALGLAEFVRDGTFDFIATDHAPHAAQDKPSDLAKAASGMLGLEVAIPTLAQVIRRGDLDWPIVIRKLTASVAETLNLPGGTLSQDAPADVTIIDPERRWTITEEIIQSKSKNTPLLGLEVQGRAVMTIVGGEILHDVL
ncbi:MAG: dihydroorotase [Thermomicrobiales bacterium]